MIKKSKFNRWLPFIKKIAYSQLIACHPSNQLGRFYAPKVLANSIPKSGTNLLERALVYTPGIRRAPVRTLMDRQHTCSEETVRRLSSIGRGQFKVAHLPSNSRSLELIHELDIKVILIIRDPRDVAISRFKYIHKIATNNPAHDYIASLENDHQRLEAVIKGMDGILLSTAKLFEQYKGWFDDFNTLTIKYEDLVGEMGGGSRTSQIQTLKKLTNHLGFNFTDIKLNQVAQKVFSSKSPTFRKGEIGSWNSTFSDYHIGLFKEATGNLLVELGYEKDHNWTTSQFNS